MSVTGCTLYEGTKDLFYKIEIFLYAELRQATRISRTEIHLVLRFVFVALMALLFLKSHAHQRFVMRSGVSYYPYLRFWSFYVRYRNYDKGSYIFLWFYVKFRIQNTQLRFSELQQDYQLNLEGWFVVMYDNALPKFSLVFSHSSWPVSTTIVIKFMACQS